VSFPVAVRGYDRKAVEAYVKRVNRVIAELEVSRSPQAAVRHAVDRVTEQTKSILQQARESAEKINATAREEGEQILAGAKKEAADLVVNASTDADRIKAEADQLLADTNAEAAQIRERAQTDAAEHRQRVEEEIASLQDEAGSRMRDLEADTEAVWNQRQELLDDMHGVADRLEEAARAAAARVSRQADGDEAAAEADAGDEEATVVSPPASSS